MVALGGGKTKPKGVEHTHTLCGEPAAAERFRDALQALAAAGGGRIAMGFGGNPNDPSGVRGGPAFEVMFNVEHWLRRKGLRDKFELTFFAPMAQPGARMGEKAVAAVGGLFGKLGIGQRYGKKITGFEPGAVTFEGGERLAADLVMFIAAIDGHPAIKASDLPLNAAGFVTIDGGCSVPGFPGVYAAGDAAALEGPEWRAKQGHLAEAMARVAAANIAADAANRVERESYLPHVNILCLMDMGNAAALVKRTEKQQKMTALPAGHWVKKRWGTYFKMSKKGLVPRLPGM
jgi:sulfide:quinone oxidoreductase